MSTFDRADLQQEATIPDNLDQPVRFGSIVDTVKDVFTLELRHFLSTSNSRIRLGELPRIDKYAVAVNPVVDPLETSVQLVRSFPDILEKLPTIAVTSTTGRNVKLGISNKFTSVVVPAAKVVSSNVAPFNLTAGMDIQISTTPTGVQSDVVQSRFILPSFMFKDITAATAEEVCACINMQAKYCTAIVSGPSNAKKIVLRAGGRDGTQFPNIITILGGTALPILGFTVNQTNQNFGSGKVAYARQHLAAELTVSVEILAESDNIRAELADLVYDFFTYVMEDRKFQFYGRSIFDDSILDETYQIILKDNEFSFSGEQEMPRQGDTKDKVYVSRVSVPVTAILYSDRIIVNDDNTTYEPPASVELIDYDGFMEPN